MTAGEVAEGRLHGDQARISWVTIQHTLVIRGAQLVIGLQEADRQSQLASPTFHLVFGFDDHRHQILDVGPDPLIRAGDFPRPRDCPLLAVRQEDRETAQEIAPAKMALRVWGRCVLFRFVRHITILVREELTAYHGPIRPSRPTRAVRKRFRGGGSEMLPLGI